MQNDLKAQLEHDIEEGHKWGGHDFKRTQVFAWMAILASVISGLWATSGLGLSSGSVPNIILGALSAVPAVLVAVESTFKYSVRYMENLSAAYDYELMKDRLEAGENPLVIRKEYNKRRKLRNEKMKVTAGVLPNIWKTRTPPGGATPDI